MRLFPTDSPLVGLSTDPSTPDEPPAFVKVDVPVRIEPPPKYLPQLTLAHSLGLEDPAERVLEGTKIVHTWLWFSIPRADCPEGGYVTLSADLDGTVLWQQRYQVGWNKSKPFLDEVP